MNNYFKNYILFGDVESHCMLCNETFKSAFQIEKHIRWENHRKLVKIQTCVPKFKQDFIYKLDKNYYCAVCNYCTKDTNIIKNHVNDEIHKTNKANPEKVNKPSIGKYEAGYVVMENRKKISNSQWNGIIGKNCVVCSMDTDDIAKHVKSQDHIINLIQTATKFEKGEYYRKINEKKFQCFTCKELLPEDIFNEHWTSKTHLENINKTKLRPSIENKYASELEKLIFEARDILMETQKDFFDMNYPDNNVTCKTCHKMFVLDLKDMLMHMKNDHTNISIKETKSGNAINAIKPARNYETVTLYVDHGKRRSDLAMVGKENFIKLSAGARKAYCTLCDVSLSPEIKVFQSHIKGGCHSGHLKLKNPKDVLTNENVKYKTVHLDNFLKNLNYSKQLASFMINKEYFVNNLSFLLIKTINYELRKLNMKCLICNIVFPPQEILKHCETNQHAYNIMCAKFLDIREEFIREVQYKKYHCGFCNQVFPFMDTLEKHLKSWKHTYNKNENKARYCLELFHQINGFVPTVEEVGVFSNFEIMYSQFLMFTFNFT